MSFYSRAYELRQNIKMKFAVRTFMLLSISFMVLIIVRFNSDEARFRWIREAGSPTLQQGTKEEIQLRFQELAKTINIYFEKYLEKHQAETLGLSQTDMRSGLIRHLTAHLNESMSTENMKQILTIVERFIKESEKTSEHLLQEKVTGDVETDDDKMNLEVARGRLSEHFMKAPNVMLSDSEKQRLTTMLQVLNRTRIPSKQNLGEPLMIHNDTRTGFLPNWKRFQNKITRYQMYSEENGLVDLVLNDLRKLKINLAEHNAGGTEIKVTMTFDDDSRAMFKPMRFPRDWDAWPDHYYFHDFERHVAEISAFHLDRLMEFRRVPPVVGRFVNITSEIEELCEDKEITDTFFTSMAGNRCFYSECDYYCDARHAVCGRPHLLEGSLMAWLPSRNYMHRTEHENPWRRSYSKTSRAKWETNPYYCNIVRKRPEFRSGRRLLDLMDLTIFDFLTGNMDRHHYYTYDDRFANNDSFMLTYDNGRGFGRSKHDEMSILTPVIQCCNVRFSTFEKLMKFAYGETRMSEEMKRSLQEDLVAPVLTDDHLESLDRRIKIVLREVSKCIAKNTLRHKKVIIDDGF